jgi:K+-transporting ATPase ATPase C chain
MNIFQEIKRSLWVTVIFTVVLCGLYPAVVWMGAQAFADHANGSLITNAKGEVVGSRLLGQNFSGAGYFHSRPSAAGANGYDATSSGGSNLGPTSQKLADAIKQRVEAYRTENGLSADAVVPADAVTASGSGLDPHISIRNAELQLARVSKTRGLPEETIKKIISHHTLGRDGGLFGEARINVLTLNLDLDKMSPQP